MDNSHLNFNNYHENSRVNETNSREPQRFIIQSQESILEMFDNILNPSKDISFQALINLLEIASRQTIHVGYDKLSKLIIFVDPVHPKPEQLIRTALKLIIELTSSFDAEILTYFMRPDVIFVIWNYFPFQEVSDFFALISKKKPTVLDLLLQQNCLEKISTIFQSNYESPHLGSAITFLKAATFSPFFSQFIPMLLDFISSTSDDNWRSEAISSLKRGIKHNPDLLPSLFENPSFHFIFQLDVSDEEIANDVFGILKLIVKILKSLQFLEHFPEAFNDILIVLNSSHYYLALDLLSYSFQMPNDNSSFNELNLSGFIECNPFIEALFKIINNGSQKDKEKAFNLLLNLISDGSDELNAELLNVGLTDIFELLVESLSSEILLKFAHVLIILKRYINKTHKNEIWNRIIETEYFDFLISFLENINSNFSIACMNELMDEN